MNVLIIDDHPLFRAGIATIVEALADDVCLVELNSVEQALEWLAGGEQADMVLLDLKLPGTNGMDGLSLLRETAPAVPVVVLSATEDAPMIRQALAHGAVGYVPKSSRGEVILNALRLVLAGGVYLPVNVMEEGGDPEDMEVLDDSGLTRRQREVLTLLAHGSSNKEIAGSLGLSENTVRVHVAAILRLLDAKNRTEAGYRAVSLGLVER